MLVLICARAGLGQPKAEIKDRVYDFGVVPHSSIVAHAFWIKSVGADTLYISEVKTGCDCATAEMATDRIPPGDSALVEFLWDIGRRTGQISRSPFIFTNASDDPLRVTMKGMVAAHPDVLEPVGLLPYKVGLAQLPTESIDSVGVVLTSFSDQPLDIRVRDFSDDGLEYFFPESIQGKGRSVAWVKIRPEAKDRELVTSATLEFLVDGRSVSRFTLPIQHKIYK
jgi:hypothetical protein